jgi:hypothetical protein
MHDDVCTRAYHTCVLFGPKSHRAVRGARRTLSTTPAWPVRWSTRTSCSSTREPARAGLSSMARSLLPFFTRRGCHLFIYFSYLLMFYKKAYPYSGGMTWHDVAWLILGRMGTRLNDRRSAGLLPDGRLAVDDPRAEEANEEARGGAAQAARGRQKQGLHLLRLCRTPRNGRPRYTHHRTIAHTHAPPHTHHRTRTTAHATCKGHG